jgi:phosphoadenosine phosphosulfate reductase
MDYKFDTEYYQALYESRIFQRKLKKAREIRDQALSDIQNGYISWSGGKDSTALLFLIREVEPDYLAVYRDADTMLPNSLEYIKRIVKKYNINLQVINAPFSIWDYYHEYPEHLDDIVHRSSTVNFEGFKSTMNKFSNDGNFDGMFWGLRAEESNARLKNLQLRGATYILNKKIVCNPLAWWKGEDIFAYLIGNNIEIHPAYFQCKFKDPERIRVGGWTPDKANNKNGEHMRWLQYYHPELYRKIIKIRSDLSV